MFYRPKNGDESIVGRSWPDFLAAQQQPDGSFPTLPYAQPGVTSLCVLAFMAHGHAPGSGPYGERLGTSGEIHRRLPETKRPDHAGWRRRATDQSESATTKSAVAGTYDHAISSLTLSELYGMNPTKSVAAIAKRHQ